MVKEKRQKVYMDVSVILMSPFLSGIQRVVIEYTRRMLTDERIDLVLLSYHEGAGSFCRIDQKAFTACFVHRTLDGPGKIKIYKKQKVTVESMERDAIYLDMDAVWIGRVKRSYLYPKLKEQGLKLHVMVYDVIPVTHPQFCVDQVTYHFADYLGAALTYADTLVVNAENTKRELELLLTGSTSETGERNRKSPKIEVVDLGADLPDQTSIKGQAKPMPACLMEAEKMGAFSRPYILMVGTMEPRKNAELLFEAYALEKRDGMTGLKDQGYNIIYAGYAGWNMDGFLERLRNHPDFGSRVFHFQGLSDEGISFLYSGARYMAFLSFIEGYGLPIVEGLLKGLPVIASDNPVSHEVGQDACLYTSDTDPGALCQLVASMDAEDGAGYERLVQAIKGYRATTWEESYKAFFSTLVH